MCIFKSKWIAAAQAVSLDVWVMMVVHIKVAFRSVWCLLLANVYEVFPLQCPNCSADMKIIAFVTEKDAMTKILAHLGEDTEPPVMQTARGPPDEIVFDDVIDDLLMTSNIPDEEYDQRITW